jgi:DNA-binding CsgD family transcriptional regulator
VRLSPDYTTDDAGALRSPPLLALVLLLFAVGFAVDLFLDQPESWRSAHVLFEVTLTGLSLAFAAWLWFGWRRTAVSLAEAAKSLEAQKAERDAWHNSARTALEGLGRAIDAQFTTWQLTATEREVALLLLKGHGHKQIAAMTGRSERTVRQHAVAVYEKSGLRGRSELAAFFLEAVLLPGQRPPVT